MMISRCFSRTKKLVAGIELGGTTAAIAIADEIGSLIWKEKGIPTAPPIDPKISIKNLSDAFSKQKVKVNAIGIASFGPVDIKNGKISTTPKPNWREFPLIQEVKKAFPNLPIVLDTDVNAPAFTEYLAFNNPKIKNVAYITIGTGIGLGVFSDGKCYHGSMHPEFGHIYLKKFPGDDFHGVCPYHSDCCEGLTSAVAIGKRFGVSVDDVRKIPTNADVWKYFIYYAAQLIANAQLAFSLDAVCLGGGVATGDGKEFLIEGIKKEVTKINNGYVKEPIIRTPHYGKDAGLIGACSIAFYPELFQSF